MCQCDELRQLYAAAAKERDELKRQVEALTVEKAALLKIAKHSGCETCAHEAVELPCGGEAFLWGDCKECHLTKIACCGCGGEINWEWKGVADFGEA